MSLKKVTAAVAGAFLALLLPLSCVENDRAMGEGLLPGPSILHLGVKTFDLPLTVRSSDSVQAANVVKMLVGTMTDPVFGTVVCNAASYILPYSDSTDFGENPELRSAYIALSVDSTYYIDQNQQGIHQRIRIYKMKSRLGDSLGFCNSISPDDYYPEPITDSDPVIYGTGEIRIGLKDEFARELLDTTPEEFGDTDLFLERIPGFYIETEPPLGTGEGGRLNEIRLGNSTIVVNYTYNDQDNGISRDTTESFAFGYNTAFNYFSTGSSGLQTDEPSDSLYLEGLSGVKPHVSASALKEMISAWIAEERLGDYTLIISRAELVLPYEMPEDFSRFDLEHPASIYAFTSVPWATDSTKYLTMLPELSETENKGEINRSLSHYSMDITSYVQNLVNMDVQDIDASMDLWLAPLTYRTNILNETHYEFDNYNYKKIILNGPSSERKPALTITYGLME